MVRPVRVLLYGIPPMLRSIIDHEIAQRSDVELLEPDSPDAREHRDVDVILTGAADPHDARHACALLTEWRKTRILVVSVSGRDVVMYEWYPQKVVIGDLSPHMLVNVIREGFGLPC